LYDLEVDYYASTMVFMFVVEIATLSKNVRAGSIYYTSAEYIPLGTGINFRIGTRKVFGVVLKCQTLQSARQFVRTIGYTIKPLPVDTIFPVLSEEQIELLGAIADTTLDSVARLVREMIPTNFEYYPATDTEKSKKKSEVRTISNDDADEVSQTGIIHIFPSAIQLRKFVSQNSNILNVSTKRGLTKALQADSSSHSAAGLLANIDLLPRYSMLVIHDPLSPQYKTHFAPRISRAWVLTNLAVAVNKEVVLVSDVPVCGYEYSSAPYQLTSTLLDDTSKNATGAVQSALSYVADNKSELLLWWHERVGIGSLQCSHCGTKPVCPDCQGKLSLREGKLVCLNCDHTSAAYDFCPNCTAPIIIHIPGIERLREVLADNENVEIVTSGALEKSLGNHPSKVLVPLLMQQMNIPHFDTIEQLMRNIIMISRTSELVIDPASSEKLNGTNWHILLLSDHQIRNSGHLPPYGGYVSMQWIVPIGRESRLLKLVQLITDRFTPKIIRGSNWLRVSISGAWKESDSELLRDIFFQLATFTKASGSIYPAPNKLLLPFF
jgi:hypothetical protein